MGYSEKFLISSNMEELQASEVEIKIYRRKPNDYLDLKALSNMNIYVVETKEELIELVTYLKINYDKL